MEFHAKKWYGMREDRKEEGEQTNDEPAQFPYIAPYFKFTFILLKNITQLNPACFLTK
jgi:hypothetical protein